MIEFYVNNKKVKAEDADLDMALVDFLHERLNLTGTKFCCGIGECKACTVLTCRTEDVNKEKTLSCSTPVESMKDMYVYTIEGVGSKENLVPLQEAFLKNFSFQCGYCTSGFLMSATVLIERLQESPVPEKDLDYMISEGMGENICRCTGYVRYIKAIKEVALNYTLERQS